MTSKFSKPPFYREPKEEKDDNQKWNFFEINPVKKYFTSTNTIQENGENHEGINEPKKFFNQDNKQNEKN